MKKIWSDKAWDDYLYWQARSFERKPQRILEPANRRWQSANLQN